MGQNVADSKRINVNAGKSITPDDFKHEDEVMPCPFTGSSSKKGPKSPTKLPLNKKRAQCLKGMKVAKLNSK